MSGNIQATLYIGNLDERVDERLLYEIMVQAGPLVEVYIPRDKESKRHKGYGFAEYRSEESAQYALNLFSGLVTLYNRTLRFAISGGGKLPQSGAGVDKSSNRFSIVDKAPHHLVEDSGPGTPCRARDVKGYCQNYYPQTHASEQYPCSSTGYGGQDMVKTDNFLTPPTHAQYYNAHLTHLSQWGVRANFMGHAYAQSASFAR
ncbi:hypothetical protein Mapa_011475 [Marchantia paleacea]|nr:hypothetical protein Mapa_011475 [Marchantia paleacea]